MCATKCTTKCTYFLIETKRKREKNHWVRILFAVRREPAAILVLHSVMITTHIPFSYIYHSYKRICMMFAVYCYCITNKIYFLSAIVHTHTYQLYVIYTTISILANPYNGSTCLPFLLPPKPNSFVRVYVCVRKDDVKCRFVHHLIILPHLYRIAHS